MSSPLRTLLEITAASGVIWAAIMLFKKAFKTRMSASAHLVVWIVFLARLLVPATFETGIHFVTLPAAEQTVASLPFVMEEMTVAQPEGAQQVQRMQDSASMSRSRDVIAQQGMPATGPQADKPNLAFTDIVLCVWIAGVVGMGLLTARGYRHLHARVQARTVPATTEMKMLFKQCRKEAGVRWPVRLAVQTGRRGPGLVFPNTVLIPTDLQQDGDLESVRYAMLHELTHFHHGHHILSVLLRVLEVVYWFNPFVWLATREIREDMETFCDSRVVRGLPGKNRATYAHTVLSFFGRPAASRAVLAISAGDVRKCAERRIRGIYLKSSSHPLARIGALVLGLALAFCSFTTVCMPVFAASIPEARTTVSSEKAFLNRPAPVDSGIEAGVYKVAERWDETLRADNSFSLSANVDVLVPDEECLQVRTASCKQVTTQAIDEMLEKLAPGMFHASDARKEAVSNESNESSYETLNAHAGRVPLLWESHSQDGSDKMIDASMGYESLDVTVVNEDETQAYVSAGVGDPQEAWLPYFDYISADYATQDTDQRIVDMWAGQEEETRLVQYELSPINVAQACQDAKRTLASLGIGEVEITACSRALWRPISTVIGGNGTELANHGVYVEFCDAADGVPCLIPQSDTGSAAEAAPFRSRIGSALIAQDGTVKNLHWEGGARLDAGTPVGDSILGLDDVKETFADVLYKYVTSELSLYYGSAELQASYSVSDVRLVSTLVLDPDSGQTRCVPAWRFTAEGHSEVSDEASVDIVINAMDGSVVGRPGSMWETDAEIAAG